MRPAAPGRVLRLALVAWGLGHLALGRRTMALALLAAEALCVVAVAALTVLFHDTSWYLAPFLAGCTFLVAWAWQAVDAYRSARASQGATETSPERSPAAVIGWLSLPLLAWGVGFWLVAATAATPAATLDRFVAGWTGGADEPAWSSAFADDPAAVEAAAATATAELVRLCRQGVISEGCASGGPNLFRDVRFRVELDSTTRATATGETVRYERRPSTFLWLFAGRETVAVPTEEVIVLQLEAEPAALGAVRWRVVSAESG